MTRSLLAFLLLAVVGLAACQSGEGGASFGGAPHLKAAKATPPSEKMPEQELARAHLGALAATLQEGPISSIESTNNSTREPDLKTALSQAIWGERVIDAAAITALRGAYGQDAPQGQWLAALADREQGQADRCRQRLAEAGRSIESARAHLAPGTVSDLIYAQEVLQALCSFDLGEKEAGNQAIQRAALQAPEREEHSLVQALQLIQDREHELAIRVLDELLAAVERPSAAAYLFCLEAFRWVGAQERLSVTLRRAQTLYPGDARLHVFINVTSASVPVPQATLCDAAAQMYAQFPQSPAHAFNHGLCLWRGKSQEHAIGVVQNALLSHPKHGPLQHLLAALYAQGGRVREAQRMWREIGYPALAASYLSSDMFQTLPQPATPGAKEELP
jgi:tetratricopeptide (TPR) repeat protein